MKTLRSIAATAILIFTATAALADETVWISSLDLSRATQGYGQPQADRSVDGHPLILDGQTFAHGFGTHSPGLLMIDLHGGSRRFVAKVGIDDEVGGGRGSAEFKLYGDQNRLLWKSGVLKQGQATVSVDVDVAGVQKLLLRVTTGGDGYDFDHADWADARLIVTGAHPETMAWQPSATQPVITMPSPVSRPEIHPPFVLGVLPGTPLLWSVRASGAHPMKYAARRLPAGLTLDPATGTMTGALAAPGVYSFEVQAMNRTGRDQRTLRIVVGSSQVMTPPLGWNSYDCFGDDVTEAEVDANARYLAANLKPYGWDYVVVDYRWYDPGASSAPNNPNARTGAALTMDASGRLLPAVNRFPSAADNGGFKALADRVHALGLKFGIHIMRGIPRAAVQTNLPIEGSSFHAADAANNLDRCGWCPDMYGVRGDTAAGQAYYDSIFRLYASWGLDYVKVDDMSAPYHQAEIEAIHRSIARCGRSIVYSLSPGETPIAEGTNVAQQANLWRESGDFWDNWASLDHEFILGERWHDYAAPGHWPDADMLPLGHVSVSGRSVGPDRDTHFTKNEQLTLMSLWAILPSPLMVGANLPDNDPWTLAILTNPEVLAVSQDSAATPGTRVTTQDECEVWARDLADGSKAVGLFNRGDFDATITADWADLRISGRYAVRDLWQRKPLGTFRQKFTATVPAHGAALLLLTEVR